MILLNLWAKEEMLPSPYPKKLDHQHPWISWACPGGVARSSLNPRLYAAIPPGSTEENSNRVVFPSLPGGVARPSLNPRLQAQIPSGSIKGIPGSLGFRGYRRIAPQPPATSCDPSGIEKGKFRIGWFARHGPGVSLVPRSTPGNKLRSLRDRKREFQGHWVSGGVARSSLNPRLYAAIPPGSSSIENTNLKTDFGRSGLRTRRVRRG